MWQAKLCLLTTAVGLLALGLSLPPPRDLREQGQIPRAALAGPRDHLAAERPGW
jgi:hypothetical protein